MNTKYFLSSLMCQAWYIVRKFGFSLADAMRQAWRVAKCKHLMRSGVVHFQFIKADGSVRDANGTLLQSMLPPTKGVGRKSYPHLVTYFDTDKGEYRCFDISKFIGII